MSTHSCFLAGVGHSLRKMSTALKLVGLVLPLGLDTLGVALALGIAGLTGRRRTEVSLLFTAFEAGMPLIGILIGRPLGHSIGGAADFAAAGLIIALGAYMLLSDDEEDAERDRLLAMTRRGLIGALALGVSISLDELAIGFSAGLLHLPLVPLVLAIAIQTFVVTQAGVRLGTRLGERWQQASERVAALALLALGTILVILRLTS